MPETRIDIVRAIFEAFGRHDIDGVLDHIAPDIVWHYHVGTRPVIGRENMARVLTKLGQHQRDSRWRPIRWAESGNSLLLEGVEDYLNPDGRRVQAPYMGVYEFDGKLVTAWRDYVDLALLLKSDAGEPMDEWVQTLVDGPG